MIRTLTYRYDLTTTTVDQDQVEARITALALRRAKLNRALYEVRVELQGAGTSALAALVHITVDGHGYWRANGIANDEARRIAVLLRTQAMLVAEQSEPTMRNLTVDQGRPDNGMERARAAKDNSRQRLAQFRERMASE